MQMATVSQPISNFGELQASIYMYTQFTGLACHKLTAMQMLLLDFAPVSDSQERSHLLVRRITLIHLLLHYVVLILLIMLDFLCVDNLSLWRYYYYYYYYLLLNELFSGKENDLEKLKKNKAE
ncbi:hypothetical protein QQ045_028040 [Rhodiola kirilowii]